MVLLSTSSSTLLKLVDRLYDAHAGTVYVGGEDVKRWPLKQLQRVCTCLSQNGGVFFSEAMLLDTIRFAKPDASFAEVMRAATLACIHDEIMTLQDGYQTKAGEHGKNLSGGQRQRDGAGAVEPRPSRQEDRAAG